MRKIMRDVLTCAVSISALYGCDADTETLAALAPTINTGSVTEIALPNMFRAAKAINPADLQLSVRVNNEITTMQRDADEFWRGSINVPANQTSRIAVEWGTEYGTSGYVKLAEQQKIIFVTSDQNDVFFDNNYSIGFDRDSDTRNNLTEVLQNRSPVSDLDVNITNSGAFATGGVEYPLLQNCGHQLPIEIRALETESDNIAWWCATLKSELLDADGNEQLIDNIEFTVSVADDQIFTDSGTNAEFVSYKDDSIEIYIDGDDNKRGAYDGINDYQFRFAPFGDGVFEQVRGPAVTPQNLNGKITYYTGGYTLVATMPLDEVGIRRGFPFGLNIEVNDDDDGGERDAKYSWIGTEGEDVSWRNTQAFGTSQLRPL